MNEIIIEDKNEIARKVHDSQIISNELNNALVNRKNSIAVLLSEITTGLKNLMEVINPDKIYVAKFPKDVLEKINLGQFDIMKTKSGELLSTIIDKTAPANKNIVHQLRLEEIDPRFTEKLQNLSTNVTNLAIQKQLADISEMLSEIQALTIDIKRGQVLDRIGLVISGKNQLEQALELPNDNPKREQLILGAIKSLNDGRSQIDLYFRDEMKNATSVPRNKLFLALKCLLDSNFYSKIENKFNGLQESFQAYIYATNLLATAYERIGSTEALPKVFEPAKSLIEDNAANMIPMSYLVLDGKADTKNQWYNHPHSYVDKIENYTKQALLDNVEYISVEIPGKKLLEGK